MGWHGRGGRRQPGHKGMSSFWLRPGFFLCAFLGVLALCVTPVRVGVRQGGRVLVGRLWGFKWGFLWGPCGRPPGRSLRAARDAAGGDVRELRSPGGCARLGWRRELLSADVGTITPRESGPVLSALHRCCRPPDAPGTGGPESVASRPEVCRPAMGIRCLRRLCSVTQSREKPRIART